MNSDYYLKPKWHVICENRTNTQFQSSTIHTSNNYALLITLRLFGCHTNSTIIP